jgi:uncharacterized protein with NRDE domain
MSFTRARPSPPTGGGTSRASWQAAICPPGAPGSASLAKAALPRSLIFALVADILRSRDSTSGILERLREVGADYNGFNVMFSDGERLAVYESTLREGRELAPGIYGLSNHLLDTPWPKVQNAKSALSTALRLLPDTSAALALLRDDRPAPDELLPRTGLTQEWERLVSSAFIRADDYGTRCSTVISIDRGGGASFEEWTWSAAGAEEGRKSYRFQVG